MTNSNKKKMLSVWWQLAAEGASFSVCGCQLLFHLHIHEKWIFSTTESSFKLNSEYQIPKNDHTISTTSAVQEKQWLHSLKNKNKKPNTKSLKFTSIRIMTEKYNTFKGRKILQLNLFQEKRPTYRKVLQIQQCSMIIRKKWIPATLPN